MNLIEIEKMPLFEEETYSRWYILPYVDGAPLGSGKTLAEALENAGPKMRHTKASRRRAIKTVDLGETPELLELLDSEKLEHTLGRDFDAACELAEKNAALKRALREACRSERW